MEARTRRGRMTAVEMPAGRYWVGDPCYAVPDHRWMEWLEDAGYTENDLLYAELDGAPVLGIGTTYGDGVYVGSDGNDYPVDAGLLGVVPVSVHPVSEGSPFGMTLVEFDAPFECRYSDGLVVLGHIEIDTDPSEDEWS